MVPGLYLGFQPMSPTVPLFSHVQIFEMSKPNTSVMGGRHLPAEGLSIRL